MVCFEAWTVVEYLIGVIPPVFVLPQIASKFDSNVLEKNQRIPLFAITS